jgi:diaminopimelate epimerase
MQLSFAKWHGLGNDYVLIEDGAAIDLGELAVRMCDRHRGIGADGLLVLQGSAGGHVGFRIFNADGTEAELCGNGLRCAAAYWAAKSGGSRVEMRSAMGEHVADVRVAQPGMWDVCMNLVAVDVGEPMVLDIDGCHRRVQSASTGNPHAIILDASDAMVERLGEIAASLSAMACFSTGINVHLARAAGPRRTKVWSWERGVGRVLACATGAAAVAKIVANDQPGWQTMVLAGGELEIDPGSAGTAAVMRGPASAICSGLWTVPPDLYPDGRHEAT